MKSFFTIVLLFVYFLSPGYSFAQFESIGPFGGYIRCLAKDNQEKILAGTVNGGIFLTSDMGENWTQIFYGYRNLGVRSLAVNFNNNYFAGTDGSGLFRSEDGGTSWTKINNVLSTSTILSLLFLPNGDLLAGTFDGLFRSTDNGNTFLATNGIPNAAVFSLGDGGSFLLAGTAYNGIFRSTDNGLNWLDANNGIDYSGTTIESIAFDNSASRAQANAYVSTGVHVYTSMDLGINYTKLPDPPAFVQSILVKPDDTIVAASPSGFTSIGGSLLYLPYGSSTWMTFNTPEVPFASLIKTTSGTMAGSYGPGTFVTTNGIDWNIKINNMAATAIDGLDRVAGLITVATRHSGSFLSEDDGNTFQNVNGNMPQGWEYEFKLNPVTNKAWVLHQNGAYKTNFGEWNNWTNTGYPAVTMGFNSQGKTFLCNGNRCYISNDDINFQSVQIGNISWINSIAFNANDIPYVATSNGTGYPGNGVWYAPDGGTVWVDITNNLPLNITTVKYVDLSGITETDCYKNIVAGSADGKYFSLNTDLSWNELDLNFTSNSLIKDIASVNYGSGIEIGAVSENEMVCVSSNCTTDERILFPDQITNKIFYFASAQRNSGSNIIQLIGTIGSGILKQQSTTGLIIDPSSLPENYMLSQNYPNPFNPSTKISFDLPEESFTTLEIYNILGEKVSTLVSENLKAGIYHYEWNAKNLPSGIYFYHWNTDGFSETKKMILLK